MSYVGVPPFGQTVRTITEVTATAGQTAFTPSGGYLPGYVDVSLNGIALSSADFTATNGTTVTLAAAAAVGDEFRCVAYWPVSLMDTYRKTETDTLLAAKVNKAGDTMTGTLQVPQLDIGSRKQFDLTNLGDETNINWDNVTRNSISYALGSSHTNAPMQGVNSIVVDLNTEGWGGGNNTASDSRGAQLWFTDTLGGQDGGTNGRFAIRMKQGGTQHPWEKVLTTYSFRRNFARQSGTLLTSTSTYQDVTPTITVTPLSAASRFLIFARFGGYWIPTGDAKGCIVRNGIIILENQRIAGNTTTQHETCTELWLDHPNTTSSVTYKLQGAVINSGSGSMDFGHGDNKCSLLIMEFEG